MEVQLWMFMKKNHLASKKSAERYIILYPTSFAHLTLPGTVKRHLMTFDLPVSNSPVMCLLEEIQPAFKILSIKSTLTVMLALPDICLAVNN